MVRRITAPNTRATPNQVTVMLTFIYQERSKYGVRRRFAYSVCGIIKEGQQQQEAQQQEQQQQQQEQEAQQQEQEAQQQATPQG